MFLYKNFLTTKIKIFNAALLLLLLCVSCQGTGSGGTDTKKIVRISYYNSKYYGASPTEAYSDDFLRLQLKNSEIGIQTRKSDFYISLQTNKWFEKKMYKKNPISDTGIPLESMIDGEAAEKIMEFMDENGFFSMPTINRENLFKKYGYSRIICLEDDDREYIVAYEKLIDDKQREAFINIGLAIVAGFSAAYQPVMIKMDKPEKDAWKYFLDEYNKEKMNEIKRDK